MYAIVDIAGQQFKVEKNKKIYVHRLAGDEGDEVSFDKVLLIDNEGKVQVGEPVLDGAMVHAKILGHLKADKVLVFKKKRRKGFKKLKGHRQFMSQILIEDILSEGGVKKATVKKEKPKAEKPAEAAVVKEAKAEKKPVEKKTTEKKVAEKKPAVKKAKTEEKEPAKAKAPVKKAGSVKAAKEAKPAVAKGKTTKK